MTTAPEIESDEDEKRDKKDGKSEIRCVLRSFKLTESSDRVLAQSAS